MGRTRTTAVVLGAAAVTALGVLGPVGTPAGAIPTGAIPAAGPAAGLAGKVEQVTLITGDRVLVYPGGRVDVRPAAGREHVRFRSYTDHGDRYVVPLDAAVRIGAGTVDRRLFDVTTLLASGYGDAARDDLPLIVTHTAAAGPAARSEVVAAGGTEVRALPGARVSTLTAPKRTATRLWDSLTAPARTRATAVPVEKVWLDGKVQASLDVSVPQIGAPTAWAAGHTGAGTTVAVLDTGLDTTHPDFAGAVTGSRDFTETGSTADDNGHGTHVASIVTGSGAASGGKYQGVAPDAKLLIGKVLDAYGSGAESWILAGMQWAAAQHADVVNMSLGSPFPDDGTDPMSSELNRLTRETGTLFVVSAGNSGPYETSIGSPATAEEALSVGAVDAQNALAEFSSRGPRYGDGAIKPDITAPGVGIVAARAAGSTLGEPVGDAYQRLSGTSMASPHVAGAAAILAGEHPTWTPEQLKAALMGSAAPTAGATVFEQGAGRVDVARATAQTAYATPASLSEGVAEWPHQDDPAITRTVTYHNDGSAPLTLSLAATATGPAGAAAPAGMFTLSAPTVTVPAHAAAAVTLTTRTTVAAPDGRYSGALVATGPGTAVRTPVAVEREVESYDVTVRARDRQGRPTPNYYLGLLSLDAGVAVSPYDESGTVVARVPKGRYYLDAFTQPAVLPDEPGPVDVYNFVEPTWVVTGDRSITLDGRAAKPIGISAPRPTEPGLSQLYWSRKTGWGDSGTSFLATGLSNLYVQPSATTAPAGQFTFGVTSVLARPDGNGGFTGSPYQYHLGYEVDGRIPTDLVRRFTDRGLAVSRTTLYAPGPGLTGVKDGTATLSLPATLTELYSPGLDWRGDLQLYPGPAGPADLPVGFWFDTTPVRYAAGSRTTRQWGRAVLSEALPDLPPEVSLPALGRLGDQIETGLGTAADAAGHLGYLQSEGGYELYRDGVLVPDPLQGYVWTVPAEPADYRLVTNLASTIPGSLDKTVRTEVRFRSGHAAETGPVTPLPVRVVRFRPAVDAHNAAPAGQPFAVPVSVERQARATGYGKVTSLTVGVSYDEGRTWTAAPVVGGKARLRHPAGATSVSLRTRIVDAAGNRTDQTIIRAYLLR